MKDYSKMSDFEINKAVSTALGMDVSGATEENNMMYGYVPDICNNPSDAWTIIIENSITFNYDTAQVHVGSYFSDTAKVSENRNKALRAAMIVYLMMKDEE